MCLILLAYRQSGRFPLVVAANRDEYHARPTATAAFWSDAPGVLAGRDLSGGGTWLGITRNGRFAAVTNYRGPEPYLAEAPTRGALVSDFLCGHSPPLRYLKAVEDRSGAYNGFNLIAGDLDHAGWYSNRNGPPRELAPEIYGVSNHLLDTPWPKVARGKAKFATWLENGDGETGELLDMLEDHTRADDTSLPDTGVGTDWERVLSSMFIQSENYGTRSSTVLVIDNSNHVTFTERSYGRQGEATGTVSLEFDLESGGLKRTSPAGAATV